MDVSNTKATVIIFFILALLSGSVENSRGPMGDLSPAVAKTVNPANNQAIFQKKTAIPELKQKAVIPSHGKTADNLANLPCW
ncbi:MAG: hypothetical protein ABFR97_08150 [Thermodesulfobacteriota bacterium]